MATKAPQSSHPIRWLAHRPVPIDFNGPADVPYVPMSTDRADLVGIRPFELAVARHPDKTAIVDGRMSLTFAEVQDRVYGLAARIAAVVPPGQVVASLVGSSAAAPIIVMACVAAGRTLVPLDAGHPLERKIALFAESGAAALIVEERGGADDSFVPTTLPRVAIDPAKITGAVRFHQPAAMDAPMLVIFTSGSTGRPKGLAFANYHSLSMARTVEMFHINANDVILGLGSLSTGGARDAFLGLTTGATIRLIDIKSVGLTEAMRVMSDERVTFMSFVPSFVRMMFSLPGIEHAVRSLRILDLHGERTLPADVALLRQKLPGGCHISITMGASETGFIFSWFVDDAKVTDTVVPVGYLMPQREIAILDEEGRSVAAGDVGELVVAGTLAAGGWQAGQLTSGRFLPHPDRSGKRVYPMGDLIRARDDGLFEYVGRRDRQIKIRGLWADLGAVEAVLRGYGGVRDAVVIVHEEQGIGDSIAAFIAPDDPNQPPDLGELRRAVALGTTDEMVPGRIVLIDTIPRLANFKPDLITLSGLIKVGK